jgi:hypothetical protein
VCYITRTAHLFTTGGLSSIDNSSHSRHDDELKNIGKAL